MMAGNPTLLVADDEIEIGKIVQTVAEDLGFDVTCVVEGSRVVGLVDELSPDVIALDLRMPGSDGVEIIRELGKKSCKAGILLMSGMDQRTLTSVQALGKESNLDIGTTLTKPMSIDAIEGALSPYVAKVKAALEAAPKPKVIEETAEYGLAVLYEPEFQIKAIEGQGKHRLRVHSQWFLDNDTVAHSEALNLIAKESGISKGLCKMVLAEAMENIRIWSNQELSPEISLQLSHSCLNDLSTPDVLARMADKICVPREWIAIEVDENSLTKKQDAVSDVLSRLRIKGFKIAVTAEGGGENILPLIDSIPIDQVILDMSQLSAQSNFANDMEIEFQYSSLTSMANNRGIVACATNVDSAEALEFVKKCNFNGARGSQIHVPVPAPEILPLYQDGKFSKNGKANQIR